MNPDTLTEREKQALRLLTSGYDAKTMAAKLGLSVHTVNERLREARRKLGTSSSREVARLLRDIEAATPENPADRFFGDAPSPAARPQPTGQAPAHPNRPQRGWLYGGIAMSLVLLVLALSTVAPPPVMTTGPSAAAVAESPAVTAARQWLALLDAGDWNASWAATGAPFRALNTSAVWAQASDRVRKPLGAVVNRDLISTDYFPAPPSGYRVVKFRTSFAARADAIETVSLIKENQDWRVVGVTID